MSQLTICGGGNAAHVLIALAAQAGWKVNVFAPLADEAERLQAGMASRGGVAARFGDELVLGQPQRISASAAEVIPGSELILLALPAFAHGPVLKAIAQYLGSGVVIGALPARGGFDYQVLSILGAAPVMEPIVASGAYGVEPFGGGPAKASTPSPAVKFFGLQTLPWACRIITFGQEVEVLGRKAAVDLAAFPAVAAGDLAAHLTPLLGVQVTPVASFLTLTLANTGQLIHPGIMYGLSRGRETQTFSQAQIPLFYQGVDQPTADLLKAMSDEVQRLSQQLADRLPDFDPHQIPSLESWLLRAYAGQIDDAGSLRRAFNTNRAYSGLKMPVRIVGPDRFVIDFQSRYLAEDVPYGLVVIKGIAELAGVATPTLDRVISWAQARLNRSYLVNGSLGGVDLVASRAPQRYGFHTLADLAIPLSGLSVSNENANYALRITSRSA